MSVCGGVGMCVCVCVVGFGVSGVLAGCLRVFFVSSVNFANLLQTNKNIAPLTGSNDTNCRQELLIYQINQRQLIRLISFFQFFHSTITLTLMKLYTVKHLN